MSGLATVTEKDSGTRILLVKHSTGWDLDRCSTWMRSNGIDCDWCYPADGDQFPDPADYSGVISFGGAVSANDDVSLPWIKDELKFIESCMQNELRFFGICLGAQLLARVLGATVRPHSNEVREVGFHPVYPTAQAGYVGACLRRPVSSRGRPHCAGTLART